MEKYKIDRFKGMTEIEKFYQRQKELSEILKEYQDEYYLLKELEPNNPKLKDLESKIINVNCALKITVRC